MLSSLLLLCLSIATAAGQDDCSDDPPPVWMFVLPEDLANSFPNLQVTLIVVEDGVVNPLLQSNQELTNQLRLGESVRGLPLVWCSDGVEDVDYALDITSSDTSVLLDPEYTIPMNGTLPSQPYRFRVFFACAQRGLATITVVANITTSGSTRTCVLRFAFAKLCAEEEVGATDTPEDLGEQLDGFVNTTIKDEPTPPQSESSSVPLGIILPSVLIPSFLIVISLSVLFAIWLRWYRYRSKAIIFHPEAVMLAYQQTHPSWDHQREPHKKEFPWAQLKLTRELGEGAFGIVHEGEAENILGKGEKTVVAVKQLKGGGDPSIVADFFREVDFMAQLEHPNIVNLLGVCSVEEPFCMVFEYMDLGDLCSFLREAVGLGGDDDGDEAESPLLTNQELVHIAHQVAKGMEYISLQHLVHRDLASRNCLVATGLVVKIADFGMSRDIHTSDYYRVKGSAVLPVRWMPPESILYGKFTQETDVWAFGVLLWEVFTYAEKPYAGLTNEEVIAHVQKGGHPDPPQTCPEAVTQLMLRCWDRSPKRRPVFAAVAQTLEDMSEEKDS